MKLVDSVGWLHCLMNGPLVERYLPHLSKTADVLMPTVVMHEVYKKIKRERGHQLALVAAGSMGQAHVAPLSPEIAYTAADMALEYKLSMADAIIYATAQEYHAKLITSDADFKDLPNVSYIPYE